MKLFIMTLAIIIVAPLFMQSGAALVACGEAGNTPQGQVLTGAGEAGSCDTTSINKLIKDIVNILSIIVGIVAVVMVIYGGFRYITSAGDGGKVAAAKSTLIYALAGLAIAALSQLIVHFVLYRAAAA
jgi:hypothetical protein